MSDHRYGRELMTFAVQRRISSRTLCRIVWVNSSPPFLSILVPSFSWVNESENKCRDSVLSGIDVRTTIFRFLRPYVVQVSNMNWHVFLLTLGYFICLLRPAITFVQALKIQGYSKRFPSLTTCHTQYTTDSSICVFLFNRTTLQVLLHTVQMLYMCTLCDCTDINKIMEFVPNCL